MANDTFGKTSHQAKTTLRGIKNPDVTQRMAAHDIKPGIKGYRDRIALLHDIKAKGKLKEAQLHKDDDTPDTDIEKEQKAIYDAQTKEFMKDARANAAERTSFKENTMEKPSFKDYITEISTDAKHKYVASAQKSVEKLGQEAMAASQAGDKETMMAKAKKLQKRNDTAIRTMGKADIETRKKWNSDFGKNKSVEELGEASPFDWKNKKSEIDWTSDEKKTETSKAGGTIHKARNANFDPDFKDRNAETGGKAAKQSVGRPKGWRGTHNIDKAKRDTPEYKASLSSKVQDAKRDLLKWKHQMHTELMKKQLETSGIDPKDHEAYIAKKNPVKPKKIDITK